VSQVKDNAAGTVFWSLSAANDSSLPVTEVLGNGITVGSTYTPWTNDLVTRKEGTPSVPNSLQDLSYTWDLNGNLQQRQDLKQSLTEAFVHDTLNRLSTSTLNGTQNLSVGYDEAGNITSKSDVGSYDYTTAQASCTYTGLTAQPHAVRKAGTSVYCYDKNGNVTSRQGGALAWTSYNLPSSIVLGTSSTTFSYNADHQRWKQDANYAGTHEVTYYIGVIMEKTTRGTGPTEYRHLIPAGSGSAILTRRSNSTTNTYYTTSDHLGSGDLVLSSTGTVLAHESFTPFGARRGANWQGVPTTADSTTFANTTRRGFTGHEMLDSVGLVHMNGRVYDPLIGRFLSADPIIQTIAMSQAINPFSYVMNNPLAMIDPSGYSWLSKVFHSVGNAFHSQVFRLVLAIAVVMALPYLPGAAGVFFTQGGFWANVAGGTIFGGIAAGNLKGAAAGGAIAAGIPVNPQAFGGDTGAKAQGGATDSGPNTTKDEQQTQYALPFPASTITSHFGPQPAILVRVT
jgi:RHS repeat-associated protein